MSPFGSAAADTSCSVILHMVLCVCVKLENYFTFSINPKAIIIIVNICCARL